jgi:hypothetical protein
MVVPGPPEVTNKLGVLYGALVQICVRGATKPVEE